MTAWLPCLSILKYTAIITKTPDIPSYAKMLMLANKSIYVFFIIYTPYTIFILSFTLDLRILLESLAFISINGVYGDVYKPSIELYKIVGDGDGANKTRVLMRIILSRTFVDIPKLLNNYSIVNP